MTTINTPDDFLRLLREDHNFYEEVRRLILTDELIQLPVQFAELVRVVRELSAKFDAFAEETNRRLAVLEEHAIQTNHRLAVLESDVATLKTDVGTLKTDVGALQGNDLERRARRNILNIASAHLGLVRGRILLAQGRDPNRGFEDAITSAEEQGLITAEQADHVMLSDIIIRARRANDRRQYVHAVLEVSRSIRQHDLERARDRAATVTAATGKPAIAAVVGQIIQSPQESQARTMDVQVIIPAMLQDDQVE